MGKYRVVTLCPHCAGDPKTVKHDLPAPCSQGVRQKHKLLMKQNLIGAGVEEPAVSQKQSLGGGS